MENSIFDLYLKDNIITKCENYFNSYLKQEGIPHEGLNEKEREASYKQLDVILDMITEIQLENGGDTIEAADIVVDKLVGLCIVSKMNEARLCRLLNESQKDKDE